LIHIIINEEFIQEKKLAIVKNSNEEKEFITKLKNKVRNINMTNIYNCKILETIIGKFASIIKKL